MRVLLVLMAAMAIMTGQVSASRVESESESSNFLMIDLNHDGVADLRLSASEPNGEFDTIEHLNAQPTYQKARAKVVDVDQDGMPDLRLTDDDHDGLYDAVSFLEQEPTTTTVPSSTTSTTTTTTTTTTTPEVIAIHPADPMPSDGIVLVKPIIFPAPSSAPAEDGAPTVGAAPANLTKPVIVDGTVSVPAPAPKPCGCQNATKPIEYRNDVKYRIQRVLPPPTPCPCAQQNTTAAQPALPPIIAKLKPLPVVVNTTCPKPNATTPAPQRIAPLYKRRAPKVLAPAPCAKNTTNTTQTIRPRLKPLTPEQKALTNVTFASL